MLQQYNYWTVNITEHTCEKDTALKALIQEVLCC